MAKCTRRRTAAAIPQRNETIVAIVTPQPALSPAIAICRGSMPADSRNR